MENQTVQDILECGEPEYVPHSIYRQQMIALSLNGISIKGLDDKEEGPIRIRYLGAYEIEVEVDLREASPSHEAIFAQYLSQRHNRGSATLTLITGTDRVLTLVDVRISLPTMLVTGGKTQRCQTYRFWSDNAKFY